MDTQYPETDNKSAIIRLFHVSKRFGAQAALTDVNLDVENNEFLFLTGPSGAGKSTLLKLLYLADTISEGQILLKGMNLSRLPKKRLPFLRRDIGVVFQDYKLIPTRTVYDNIALVLEVAGANGKFVKRKVSHLLRTVDMEHKAGAYPQSLSGGEQQRVAVARAICGDPDIVLADEPTGSLDAESAKVIMDLLSGIHARGATVLVATHDEALLKNTRRRIVTLKQGCIVDQGF
ncbi:MAG: cell division ATP-binding protein FtsE [Desulfatibacillum sp.]|nr:cell division ATP-binding protein FtsE [Desulfatibacillum sp.]